MAKKNPADDVERQAQAASISPELMAKRRKAAGDVTRMRINRLLSYGEELTAKEMAEELEVGLNGLYYHLRVMEDAEFITAGAGRATGSGMERTYRRSDKWLVTHDELNEDVVHQLQAILEVAKHEVAQGIYRQIAAMEKGEELPIVVTNSPGFLTTAHEIKEFSEKLWDLQMEFRERGQHLRSLPADDAQPLRELFCAYAVIEREPSPRRLAAADAVG